MNGPLKAVPPVAPRRTFDGAALLDEVHAALARYVAFPGKAESAAYALWIAATHAQTSWEHATRFVFKSPIKRCGKTRAQEIGRELVHRPISTTNISVAALVRILDETDPPTLFLDEADAIFGKKSQTREGAEDLRGILNCGHSRGWPYVRWDVKARTAEECPTFAMALLGGIGDMPDTIEDRAIVVSMRRRAPSERVDQFRRRRVVPALNELRTRLHEWVLSLDGLADAEPKMGVEDRDADTWEPLVVIADQAGGHWPATARAACATLCGGDKEDDGTAGERLLADLSATWGEEDQVFTVDILARLHRIEDAPWPDWYGRPLNARDLARLLRPYGVKPKTIRHGEATAKGYDRADLADSWRRYVSAVTPSQTDEDAGLTSEDGRDGNVTDERHRSVTRPEQEEQTNCDAVTAVAPTDAELIAMFAEKLGAEVIE